jgi:branched-chain amino acid transport system permease protein
MFLEQLANGLVLGSIYALIAVGYSLQLSILRVINLAHGEIMMFSTFAAYVVMTRLNQGPAVAIVAAMATGAILGLLLERLVLRPLRGTGELAALVATIGVGALLQAIAVLIFGFEQRAFPRPSSELIDIAGAQVTTIQIAILATAAACMALLHYMVQKTRYGRAIRATSELEKIAASFGVNVPLVKLGTVAMSSAIGALAGVLIAMNVGVVSPFIGSLYGLKALVVVIIGGAAAIGGAFLGGVLLGVIEVMAASYFLSEYRDAIAYLALLIVLAIRPTGLLARAALR